MDLGKCIDGKLLEKEQEAFLEAIRKAALRDTPEGKKLRKFLKKLGLWEEPKKTEIKKHPEGAE